MRHLGERNQKCQRQGKYVLIFLINASNNRCEGAVVKIAIFRQRQLAQRWAELVFVGKGWRQINNPVSDLS